MNHPSTPEFSREISLSELPRGGKSYRLQTDDDVRAVLARRLRIPAVLSFEGEMHVKASRRTIRTTGRLSASLTRECVVSLEDCNEILAEDFDLELLRGEPKDDAGADVEGDIDVLREYHNGETLDVGEILVQQLSLAMDPYPRKPGAASLAQVHGTQEERTGLAIALEEAVKKK